MKLTFAPMRRSAAVTAAIGLLIASPPAHAGPHIEVRGASRLDMRASGPASHILIAGSLVDEMGSPIALASVAITAQTASGVSLPWATIQPCAQQERLGSDVAEVDPAGAWCVLASLPQDRATLSAFFGGDSLHEGTRKEIVWDASQQSVSLSFAPRPERLDLDVASQRIGGRVDVPTGFESAGVALHLKDERGTFLSAAQTDGSGLAAFDVPTDRLQGPGVGSLQLEFMGTSAVAATSISAAVTRVARVRLLAEKPLIDGDPTSGIHVGVRATTSRGIVETGAVEGWLDDEMVGSAPIQKGRADIVVGFTPRQSSSVDLRLQYVPSSPFLLPSQSTMVTIQPSRGLAWLRFVPVALVVLVAAWLIKGWYRPKRMERTPPQPRTPTGVQSLDVTGHSTSADRWTGRVIDAQDGTPVARAKLCVVAPSFVDVDIVLEAESGQDGRFEFTVQTCTSDLKLVVEAPSHSELTRPLPAPAEMVICLVNRRRMILQRLVDWARRAGRPWDQPPEPTPGQIAGVARSHARRDDIRKWADHVERIAYGHEPVDSRAERDVLALEPGRQPLR